jgi:uncharacterized protein (TIGR02598 family)
MMQSSNYQSIVRAHAHAAQRARVGFSLVETVLAMAVMSMAITALLGLLPHGLEMSRKAGNAAGEVRIASDIIAELSQARWDDLRSYNGRKYEFNDQGIRNEGGRANSLVSYVARVKLEGEARIPGSSSAIMDLRRVVIEIASTTRSNFDFDAKGASFSSSTHILNRSGD